MINLINLISEKRFLEADELIDSIIPEIMEHKLFEMKKATAAKMCEQMGIVGPTRAEKLRMDVLEEKDKEEDEEESSEKEEEAEEENEKDEDEEYDDEDLNEARIKLIKARIRGGKVQRRKKVSNVPGMTLRGGQLKRMSAAERRRRKMGARRGKMKRKAKMTRSLMKRKRSLQKRRSLGL